MRLRHILLALPLFGLVSALIAAQPEAPKPAQKAKDGPVAPLTISAADNPVPAGKYAELTINASPEDQVKWDVFPPPVQTTQCCGNKLTFGGTTGGTYRATATVINFDAKRFEVVYLTLTFAGKKDDGNDDNDDSKPKPKPKPQPQPDPDPVEADPSTFVIVEDTSKPGLWRGQLLASPKVNAFYKALAKGRTDPIHQIIDVGAAAAFPGDSYFLNEAKGKELPYLFILDGKGNKITALTLPKTDDDFIAAFKGSPHQRAMGNNPPDAKVMTFDGVFGASDNVPLIPRAMWPKTGIDLSAYLPVVYDQDGRGQCNCSATCTVMEACMNVAGLPPVHLSAGDLYSNINGGRDQGSTLQDALAWIMKNGVATTKTVPYVWDGKRYNSAAVQAERAKYKVTEAYLCPDFDAMVSALLQGFFIDEGLMWYTNFNVDRDGWLPARGTGRPGGHALCGYGVAERDGVWGIKTRNSWGPTWGKNGNCIIPESLFGQQIGGFYAVRAVARTDANYPYPKSAAPRLNPFAPKEEFALGW